jgi:predicted nucleotidyltransferase
MYLIIGTDVPKNRNNMLTKKQVQLLKPFQGGNIFKEYGVRELARASNEKSSNNIQLALRQFVKENLVNERKQGASKLYSINLSNDLVYDYLELIKYENLSKEVIYSIESLKKEIEKYTFYYSLVIFGSYSIGKQTKQSDLDVAIFIPNKSMTSDMQIATNMVKTSSLLPLHIQIIISDDFFEMLINKEFNVGKEIAKKHRAVHNSNIFYKIIKKALDHGFKY